jgi:hypothetical protein
MRVLSRYPWLAALALSSCTGYFHSSSILFPPKGRASEAPLSVSTTTPKITLSNAAWLQVEGGLAPFQFEIASGTGSVDSTGLFTPLGTGTVQILVSDSVGASSEINLEVVGNLSASHSSISGVMGSQTTVNVLGGVPPFSFAPANNGWSVSGSSSGELGLGDWGIGSLGILDALGNSFTVNTESYFAEATCPSLNPADLAWVVRIRRSGIPLCSGVLASETRVLVPASCVEGWSAAELTVETLTSTTPLSTTVASVMIHHEYSLVHASNDIGILRLASPLVSGAGSCPTPPPRPSDSSPLSLGSNVLVGSPIQWIDDNFMFVSASANFQLLSVETALGALGRTDPNPSKLIAIDPGSSTCPLDLGSPVILNGQAVGFTVASSQPSPCAAPSLAIRIDAYLDWLSAHWN